MLRRLSLLKVSSRPSMSSAHGITIGPIVEEETGVGQNGLGEIECKFVGGDEESSRVEATVPVIFQEDPLPPPTLKVKRVDCYYSSWAKGWKYRNMNSKVVVETIPVISTSTTDQWKEYGLVLIRTIPQKPGPEPAFKFVIKSPYIIKICKEVIQSWPGISWNSDPLELEPEIFIIFYPNFCAYRDKLLNITPSKRSLHDSHLLSSVSLLLNTITRDFQNTLNRFQKQISHAEITFDLLYALLVPRTLFVAQCTATGLPRVFYLSSFTRVSLPNGRKAYQLQCESVDLVDGGIASGVGQNRDQSQDDFCRAYSCLGNNNNSNNRPNIAAVNETNFEAPRVGRVQTTIFLEQFEGTIEITKLAAYPIRFHPNEAQLREQLIQRGNKWLSLIGVRHMQYNGTAVIRRGAGSLLKQNVRGRIMVDRATFRRLNPSYAFPTPVEPKPVSSSETMEAPNRILDGDIYSAMPTIVGSYANGTIVKDQSHVGVTPQLSDEDLLLTSTLVYGFSFPDKLWLEFNVDQVKEIQWNDEAFKNLVIPSDRKNLLQSLVEAHHKGIGFDDFIKEKGQGLVVNLFGPPGVGKTFSAEATSEHVRRPLYVVGSGDLGTTAGDLDRNLERIFDIATAWRAIVLIDEADVFLEKRSLHDLERNAMVAVFLRHVEYYRGILFLTTNRVSAFDEAFFSRIHVALHFTELSEESRRQVWTAFINKIDSESLSQTSPEQIRQLAKREVNGRQIKNAVKTAQSLAVARGERVRHAHFVEALNAIDDFTKAFKASSMPVQKQDDFLKYSG
ncbi:hypothetical protein AX17_003665 [Amanita inopinata Kibby_2008]|nr:hypothetical protein AX17_003665 [Amanita inopinata Kibby_2008]